MIFCYVKKIENTFPNPEIKSIWTRCLGGFFWTRFFLKKSDDTQEKRFFFGSVKSWAET